MIKAASLDETDVFRKLLAQVSAAESERRGKHRQLPGPRTAECSSRREQNRKQTLNI